jgi:hypothetical protein
MLERAREMGLQVDSIGRSMRLFAVGATRSAFVAVVARNHGEPLNSHGG